MFGNILFPVDFSGRCDNALRHVAALARRFNSKVTLLHAIGDYTKVFTPDAPSSFAWREWLLEDAQRQIKAFGHPALDEFVAERVVSDGEPAEVIQKYCAEHPVDLIALPTHGRGLFRRLLLGSVSSKVMHDCSCPVWTTANSAPEAFVPEAKTVLCAIGLQDSSKQVLQSAKEVARSYGAVLRLIHVVPVPGDPQESMMNQEFANFLADTATKQLSELQKDTGVSCNTAMLMGDAAAVIRQEALDCHADLIVVGRGHVREPYGQFLATAHSIIRDSPCPVLSV